MNADSIEDICAALVSLRQNPSTKKRFPREIWDAIVRLTKTHSQMELCQKLQLGVLAVSMLNEECADQLLLSA